MRMQISLSEFNQDFISCNKSKNFSPSFALCSRNFQNVNLGYMLWAFFKFTATQILREIKC